jgi:hypothetical protein
MTIIRDGEPGYQLRPSRQLAEAGDAQSQEADALAHILKALLAIDRNLEALTNSSLQQAEALQKIAIDLKSRF